MKNVSIRLHEGFIKEAERLSRFEMVDTSAILRESLERGLADVRIEIAIELFSKGKVSVSEAADIANLGVGEMMDELVKRGVKQEINIDDIRGSLERAMKTVK